MTKEEPKYSLIELKANLQSQIHEDCFEERMTKNNVKINCPINYRDILSKEVKKLFEEKEMHKLKFKVQESQRIDMEIEVYFI